MKNLKIIVCGGRFFANVPNHVDDKAELQRLLEQKKKDLSLLDDTLDYFLHTYGISSLCDGDAVGADRAAGAWAGRNNVPRVSFPITKEEWAKFGRGAGHYRNVRMLEEFKPDCVIAFKGGNGTEDMIKETKARGAWLFQVSKDA